MLILFTTSGLLFLEGSLVAFLLQENYTTGLKFLTQTLVVLGVIVADDVIIKAIYIFGFGIPLFIDASETTNRVKWGLWIVHKLLLTATYGFILFMHHSKWRERLPGNHSFTYVLFTPPSKVGKVDEGNTTLMLMERKGCLPDKFTYTILIIGHCMKGRMVEAIQLFDRMVTSGYSPDHVTFGCLTSCLLKAAMPDEANRVMLMR